MAPISVFFTHPNGKYIGVDILKRCIDFCKHKYSKLPRTDFYISNDFNPAFEKYFTPAFGGEMRSENRISYGEDWPIADESVDIVTSIAVFPHLQEVDAFGYMNKIYRILKLNGIAILTFHIINKSRNQPIFTSKKNPHFAKLFDFHTPLPPSYNWFTSTPELPERAIAINRSALDNLTQGKFQIELLIEGTPTGGYDPFFQDIVVLRKISRNVRG